MDDAWDTDGAVEAVLTACIEGKSLREVLGWTSEDVSSVVGLALTLLDQGRGEAARTLLAGLSALDPERREWALLLGWAWMRDGQWAQARAVLEQVVEGDSQNVAAHTLLGEALIMEGKPSDARHYLKRAISLDPEGQSPYGRRAQALEALLHSPGV